MRRTATRALAALTLSGVLFAQLHSPPPAVSDDQDDEEPPVPRITDTLPLAPNPQTELIELFQRVERRLHEMGGYLLGASAGDTQALEQVGESGLEELLRQARPERPQPSGGVGDLLAITKARGEQVLEDIDRILEIASKNGGT